MPIGAARWARLGHMMLRRFALISILGLRVAIPVTAQDPDSGAPPQLTIGPGDVLEISVLGVEELSRKVRVLPDGTVTMPLLGNFSIEGYTVPGTESLIERLLTEKRLVNDPQVSIFVAESVSGSVTVQGAVLAPGSYELFGRSTILEVLGRAGGLSEDRGPEILVLRRGPDDEQIRLTVDASRLIDEGEISANLRLHPGDIVVVPVARALRVYVTGAVDRPGAVDFSSSEGITVLQAITAAGGPTERANLKKVTIKRRGTDGVESSLVVNVKAIQRGKHPDVALEANDTVVVGEWLL